MMMWQMLGSGIGGWVPSMLFLYAMFQQYFPERLQLFLRRYTNRLLAYFNPYIEIKFHEYTGNRFERNEFYTAIQTYLDANSSDQAKRLKADIGKNSKNLGLSMDDYEEVKDVFQGAEFWWASMKYASSNKQISFTYYATDADDKRFYKLIFHRKFRGLVKSTYLNHVMEVGKAIAIKNRQIKLYTNLKHHGYWSGIVFKHPANFDTLAMDAAKKREIIDDLTMFSQAKDYYAKIGKAWKRGYLLYGPPGTGKSSMIAAIANFLSYDIYDLELTAVNDNSELRKLLIKSSSKSVIVIEDIDCSVDLTGDREKKQEKKEEEKDAINTITKKANEAQGKEASKVTLSGLLNFIDGLWSVCGEERIIVFTTNYKDKIDPALIRSGRMDKHIEMSYCTYGAFQVLSKNYLDLDAHPLFETVKELLEETNITPADVAESLMPKHLNCDFAEACLEELIQGLQNIKAAAKMKGSEEGDELKLSKNDEGNVAEPLNKTELNGMFPSCMEQYSY